MQMEVFSNVDGQVGVERLQLFGEQFIGQRVEAIGVPVESGPFQEVKSKMTETASYMCLYAFHNHACPDLTHVENFLLQ